MYTYAVETRKGVVVIVRNEWCRPAYSEAYIIRTKALAIPLDDLGTVMDKLKPYVGEE